ncbi:MAG TPA: hypothetical protein VKT81_16255 [Bryobacteraceae bacterium]|nr:hypothetical protein [Bryobacteraceae bacterium]
MRRSHSRNLIEKVFRTLGCDKYRCRACGLGYFRFGGSVLIVQDIARPFRLICRYVAAAAAVFASLYVIRWIVLRLADPGPSG